MPRRVIEAVPILEPPKKKLKVAVEELCSLDVSFTDDEALPSGIVFTDIQQKKWRIGKPIGRGSFGRIYLASDEVGKEVTKANARYVVKIEPHSNGPLFVEIHCLIKAAQVAQVKGYRLLKKQKCLGMPVYIASGSFTEENTRVKYRFLVLPRYDIDLQKIISRTRTLDLKNVLVLAIQILDVLEYLHNQGYTHSDIKSSNLMLGFEGSKIDKQTNLKPSLSFEKETKEVAVLSGKHRRAKTGKTRYTNYYDDEDFIVKDYKSPSNSDDDTESDKKLASVKKKLRIILSDRDSRTLHRHHAFNLRQLSNNVNYEDLNSSVCSDQSYQKLLDDFTSKPFIRTSEEFKEDIKKRNNKINNDICKELGEIHTEAILSQSSGQIYLLDYGLASKFIDSEGNHKDFGMDARKAHDGTLEYSSRDSHIGAHSRRSDLETLGYNILDWLSGTLPWKTTEVLAEPDLVHALKKNFMDDIKSLLKTCFKTEFYPQFMEKYLEYVISLEFTGKPDYDYCRNLFKNELLKSSYISEKNIVLNFIEAPMSPVGRNKFLTKRFGKKNTPPDFLARSGNQKKYERENVYSFENDLKLELLKHTLNLSNDGIRKPCTSRNFFVSDSDLIARLKKSLMPHEMLGKKLSPKNLRSKKKIINRRKGKRDHRNSIGKFGNFMGSARQFTWAEILAGNPEDIIRKERNTLQNDEEFDDDDEDCKYRIRKISSSSSDTCLDSQSPILQKEYLQGVIPTYAMKEVIANYKKKMSGKTTKQIEESNTEFEGYTPEMIRIYKVKKKRESKEKQEAVMKQADILKSENVCQVRQTRSGHRKNVEKSPATPRRTRQSASAEKKLKKHCEKTLESNKTRNNVRIKSQNVKTEVNNKVMTTESPPKTIKKPSCKRLVAVPNRRRLRSSLRKQKG